MTKNLHRRHLLKKLHAIQPQIFRETAERAWNFLLQEDLWKNAEALLAYSSLNDEIDSQILIEHSLQAGKQVFLPAIDHRDNMIFRQIFHLRQLEKHPLGFFQPAENAPLFIKENFRTVLLAAPAVAANQQGYRLGRGKGYYDRLLAKKNNNIKTIVVILEDFLTDFPTESFDIPFQYILSGRGLLKSV